MGNTPAAPQPQMLPPWTPDEGGRKATHSRKTDCAFEWERSEGLLRSHLEEKQAHGPIGPWPTRPEPKGPRALGPMGIWAQGPMSPWAYGSMGPGLVFP